MNLKTSAVHEHHEKFKCIWQFALPLIRELLLKYIVLICFVNFVFFVDQKRF